MSTEIAAGHDLNNHAPAQNNPLLPATPVVGDADYSQAVVDKQMRRTIVEVCRTPVGELRELTPEQIKLMPAFKAMWISIVLKASHDSKPDMRAAEFIQEHLAGKAIQRIESHTTTVTYQDLINKVRKSEEKFQDIVTVTALPIVSDEPNWENLK